MMNCHPRMINMITMATLITTIKLLIAAEPFVPLVSNRLSRKRMNTAGIFIIPLVPSTTPYKSQWVFFVFVSLFAAFIPDHVVGDMTSIGTLFAFVLVCIGILIIRKKAEHRSPFRTPAVWVVAPLGALICLAMIASLGIENWMRLVIWLAVGFVIYFGYGRRNSKVQHGRQAKTTTDKLEGL